MRFRSYFGAGILVILDAWGKMNENNLLLPGLLFRHYLWALVFMCVYPKNEAALSVLLEGKDPKTIRKHTWPFIYALYELKFYVVSIMFFIFFGQICTLILTCLYLYFLL